MADIASRMSSDFSAFKVSSKVIDDLKSMFFDPVLAYLLIVDERSLRPLSETIEILVPQAVPRDPETLYDFWFTIAKKFYKWQGKGISDRTQKARHGILIYPHPEAMPDLLSSTFNRYSLEFGGGASARSSVHPHLLIPDAGDAMLLADDSDSDESEEEVKVPEESKEGEQMEVDEPAEKTDEVPENPPGEAAPTTEEVKREVPEEAKKAPVTVKKVAAPEARQKHDPVHDDKIKALQATSSKFQKPVSASDQKAHSLRIIKDLEAEIARIQHEHEMQVRELVQARDEDRAQIAKLAGNIKNLGTELTERIRALNIEKEKSERLLSEISDREQTIKSLTTRLEDIEEMRKRLAEAENAIAEAKKQTAEYEGLYTKSLAQNRELNDELTAVRVRHQEAIRLLEETRKSHDAARPKLSIAKMAAIQTAIVGDRSNVEKAAALINSLNDQMTALKADVEKLEEINRLTASEKEALNLKLAQSNTTRNALEGVNAKLKEEAAKLGVEIEAERLKNRTLERDMTSEKARLGGVVDSYRKSLTDAETKAREAVGNYEKINRALQNAEIEKSTALSELNTSLEKVRLQATEERLELSRKHREEITALNDAMEKLRKVASDSEAAHKIDMSQLQGRLEELNVKLANEASTRQAAETRYRDMKSTAKAAEEKSRKTANDLIEKQRLVDEGLRELSELRNTMRSDTVKLDAKIKELETNESQLNNLHSSLQRAESDLRNKDSLLDKAKADLRARESEVSALNSTIAAAKTASAECLSALDYAKNQITDLTRDSQQYKEQLEDNQRIIRAKASAIQDLEGRQAETFNSLQIASQRLNTVQKERGELATQLELLKNTIAVLTSAKNEADRRANELQRNLDRIQGQLQQASSENSTAIAELTSKLAEAKRIAEDYKSQAENTAQNKTLIATDLEAQRAQTSALTDKIRLAEGSYQRMQAQLAQSREELEKERLDYRTVIAAKASIEEQLAKSKSDSSKAKADISRLTEDLKSAKRATTEAASKFERELSTITQRAESSTAALSSLKEEISALSVFLGSSTRGTAGVSFSGESVVLRDLVAQVNARNAKYYEQEQEWKGERMSLTHALQNLEQEHKLAEETLYDAYKSNVLSQVGGDEEEASERLFGSGQKYIDTLRQLKDIEVSNPETFSAALRQIGLALSAVTAERKETAKILTNLARLKTVLANPSTAKAALSSYQAIGETSMDFKTLAASMVNAIANAKTVASSIASEASSEIAELRTKQTLAEEKLDKADAEIKSATAKIANLDVEVSSQRKLIASNKETLNNHLDFIRGLSTDISVLKGKGIEVSDLQEYLINVANHPEPAGLNNLRSKLAALFRKVKENEEKETSETSAAIATLRTKLEAATSENENLMNRMQGLETDRNYIKDNVQKLEAQLSETQRQLADSIQRRENLLESALDTEGDEPYIDKEREEFDNLKAQYEHTVLGLQTQISGLNEQYTKLSNTHSALETEYTRQSAEIGELQNQINVRSYEPPPVMLSAPPEYRPSEADISTHPMYAELVSRHQTQLRNLEMQINLAQLQATQTPATEVFDEGKKEARKYKLAMSFQEETVTSIKKKQAEPTQPTVLSMSDTIGQNIPSSNLDLSSMSSLNLQAAMSTEMAEAVVQWNQRALAFLVDLKIISQSRATITGNPNFALEATVKLRDVPPPMFTAEEIQWLKVLGTGPSPKIMLPQRLLEPIGGATEPTTTNGLGTVLEKVLAMPKVSQKQAEPGVADTASIDAIRGHAAADPEVLKYVETLETMNKESIIPTLSEEAEANLFAHAVAEAVPRTIIDYTQLAGTGPMGFDLEFDNSFNQVAVTS